MKVILQTSALLLACLTAASLQASDGSAEYATCVACHGAAGEGNSALQAPALAGQNSNYLIRQLQHFKSGVRGADPKDTLGMQMRGMAGTLADDAAIENVVAYIAAFPVPAAQAGYEFNQRNGENQYNSACGACHGAEAQGNPALNAPRLAGLDAAYLERQYKNFGSGLRGAHPKDRYGRQMKMMATMLRTDADRHDVIGFILTQ